jgi:hypothetical protein
VLFKLIKGETTLFNHLLDPKGDFVSGIKMLLVLNQVGDTTVGSKSYIKTMAIEINKLHKILDHCGETHLKTIANGFAIKVFGKPESC